MYFLCRKYLFDPEKYSVDKSAENISRFDNWFHIEFPINQLLFSNIFLVIYKNSKCNKELYPKHSYILFFARYGIYNCKNAFFFFLLILQSP